MPGKAAVMGMGAYLAVCPVAARGPDARLSRYIGTPRPIGGEVQKPSCSLVGGDGLEPPTLSV